MDRLRYAFALALALAACSDGAGGDDTADAGGTDGPTDDGTPDLCYREVNDRGNGADPEATGLSLGVGRVAICGDIDVDHPGATYLDIDRYEVAVSTGGPAVLRFVAPAAGALDRVDVLVRSGGSVVAVARVHGGIGVTLLPLTPGLYTVSIEAEGASGIDVAYQLELVDDDPAARCPIGAQPPPADYVEADESAAGHRANDVVSVRVAPAIVTGLTAIATDAPEDTVLAVSAGGRKSIAGVSADVEPAEDPYHDRDTFAFYTGQSTNVLEVRAAWSGALADLDLFVFEADRPGDPMGRPAVSLTGEILATAVKPSTRYWIWVAGAGRSTRLPAPYRIAMCGRELPVGPGF